MSEIVSNTTERISWSGVRVNILAKFDHNPDANFRIIEKVNKHARRRKTTDTTIWEYPTIVFQPSCWSGVLKLTSEHRGNHDIYSRTHFVSRCSDLLESAALGIHQKTETPVLNIKGGYFQIEGNPYFGFGNCRSRMSMQMAQKRPLIRKGAYPKNLAIRSLEIKFHKVAGCNVPYSHMYIRTIHYLTKRLGAFYVRVPAEDEAVKLLNIYHLHNEDVRDDPRVVLSSDMASVCDITNP